MHTVNKKPVYFSIMEYPPPVYPIPLREPCLLPAITNGLLPQALLPINVNRMPRLIQIPWYVNLIPVLKLPHKLIKNCGRILHQPFKPSRLKTTDDHLPGLINEKQIQHLPPVSLFKHVIK